MSGVLLHSPADIVRYSLIDEGVGTLPTLNGVWPIFAGDMPDAPDNVISVYDTQGYIHGRSHYDGEILEHHGLSIMVRSVNHATGYSKSKAVCNAFDTGIYYTTVNISGTTYTVCVITRKSDILSLGKETPDSKRRLFSINAIVALIKD